VRRLVLLLAACLLAGCAGPVSSELLHEPVCDYQEEQDLAMVLLMAQAVPSASQIPCVELRPTGWSVGNVFFRNGLARFALHSDRVGMDAVVVVLEQFCTFGRDVSRVPSDHPGIRRFEEVISIQPGRRYRGAVYYLFPGGCVTYRLDFRSDEQARPLGEVNLALGFVARDAISKTLSDFTQGRVQLDPTGADR
jgi:hypothetical protein